MHTYVVPKNRETSEDSEVDGRTRTARNRTGISLIVSTAVSPGGNCEGCYLMGMLVIDSRLFFPSCLCVQHCDFGSAIFFPIGTFHDWFATVTIVVSVVMSGAAVPPRTEFQFVSSPRCC